MNFATLKYYVSCVLILFVCFCCLHDGFASTEKARNISYTIEPIIIGASSELKVTAEFNTQKSKQTVLVLPYKWAGEVGFDKMISGLTVVSGNAEIKDLKRSYKKIIIHKPNQVVRLQYYIRQKWFDGFKRYWPIINNKYFYFIGFSVFVYPESFENKDVNVKIAWRVPKKWKIANSYGVKDRRQSFNANMNDFLESLYVAGDFKIKKKKVEGNPVYLAVRGDWDFKPRKLLKIIGRIIESQRDFFDDHNFPIYLITIMPTGEECCAYGGIGLTNSFATFISGKVGINSRIKHLYSHEHFHTWNPNKIDAIEDDEQIYWFVEGFTDYYSRLFLLRDDLITLPEYVDAYNEKNIKILFVA